MHINWPLPLRASVSNAPVYFYLAQDVLALLTIICWSIAYVLYIRQGFRDKSCGMPIISICGNITWEFLYGSIYAPSLTLILAVMPWLLLDIAIFYLTVKFGPREFERSPAIAKNFVSILIFLVVLSVLLHIAVIKTIGLIEAICFTAFVQQTIIDCESVAHMMSRNSTAGHSLMIWFSRTVGTFSVILLFGWGYFHYPAAYGIAAEPLMLVFFATIIIAALLYPFVYISIEAEEMGDKWKGRKYMPGSRRAKQVE